MLEKQKEEINAQAGQVRNDRQTETFEVGSAALKKGRKERCEIKSAEQWRECCVMRKEGGGSPTVKKEERELRKKVRSAMARGVRCEGKRRWESSFEKGGTRDVKESSQSHGASAAL